MKLHSILDIIDTFIDKYAQMYIHRTALQSYDYTTNAFKVKVYGTK